MMIHNCVSALKTALTDLAEALAALDQVLDQTEEALDSVVMVADLRTPVWHPK